MPTPWRQGDVIEPSHAVELELTSEAESTALRFVVLSHSCDLALSSDFEPTVEVVAGKIVPLAEASNRNGHSIRFLNLSAVEGHAEIWILYMMSERRFVSKAALFARAPSEATKYTEKDRRLLATWISQRYSRSAFPDQFVDWLSECGMEKRIERIAKSCSGMLRAIYVDLDDDTEHERPEDPYELGLLLVYDSEKADAQEITTQAAIDIVKGFQELCIREDGPYWIDFRYCNAISDRNISMRDMGVLQRWRFEHRSLDGQPRPPAE